MPIAPNINLTPPLRWFLSSPFIFFIGMSLHQYLNSINKRLPNFKKKKSRFGNLSYATFFCCLTFEKKHKDCRHFENWSLPMLKMSGKLGSVFKTFGTYTPSQGAAAPWGRRRRRRQVFVSKICLEMDSIWLTLFTKSQFCNFAFFISNAST